MKPKMDLIAGIFLFIFSVVMFWASYGIKMLMVSRIGSAFVPRIVAVAMGVLSLVLVIQSLLKMKNETAAVSKEIVSPLKSNIPIIGTFIALILYAVLFEPLGFIVTTALYLFVQFYLLTSTVKRNYLVFFVSAAATSVIVYYLFVKAFQLMLPAGILG